MHLDEFRVAIWGAKGRGKVINSFLKEKLNITVECFVDIDPNLVSLCIDGVLVLSDNEFISKHNREDTIVIIGCYNPIFFEQITAFLNEHKFAGQIIDNYDFHHYYELPIFTKRADKKIIDFEKKIMQWSSSFLAEAKFWKDEVINPAGQWHDHYLTRVNSSKLFKCDRANEYIKNESIVLDVGCGICSNYGRKLENGEISIEGVDPLAYIYNRLNQEAFRSGLTNGIRPDQVRFGMFEMLSYMIDKNSVDAILIDNALDHCIDPMCSIVECLKVIKVGGVLSTFHHIDEAYKAFYTDMHQWNICSNKEGHFVIWNNDSCVDINNMLGDYADISTQIYESHRSETPFGGVVCNIVKKKDIPDDFMDTGRERIGMVVNQIMIRLADPMYACDYLKFCLDNENVN